MDKELQDEIIKLETKLAYMEDFLNQLQEVTVEHTNLIEKLEKETARRVVDFISGGVYALGASIQKVANGIFLIAPYNVNIMADVRDELRNTGIFPWE